MGHWCLNTLDAVRLIKIPAYKAKLFTRASDLKPNCFHFSCTISLRFDFVDFGRLREVFSLVRALRVFIGTYSYRYDAEFTSLASEIVSKLLFTHKKFCFKLVRYISIS